MAVTKDPERGTWTVQCWYRDWQGARRKKTKRGFKSRASALAWERNLAARSADAIDMRFGDFFDVYAEDVRPRLKLNTWLSKEHMVRRIVLPRFLADEVRDHLRLFPKGPGERVFEVTKSWLHHEMDRGAKAASVKRIRIHDLRHSHVSLLIEMGFNPLNIADRMGHESVNITFSYAHLFPNEQAQIASALNEEKGF